MSGTIVVDTSPLIFLGRIGLLEILKNDAETVLVPIPVVEEVSRWDSRDSAVLAIESLPWLHHIEIVDVPEEISKARLGSGESSVLALALTLQAAPVIDDLAARRLAGKLGLECRGTLGLVLRAKKLGLIPEARPVLESLRRHGMYLSSKVLDHALTRVGE
jgi:predicted nucleic acid-binding protein